MMNRKKLVIGHLALAVVLLLFLSLAVQAKPKDKGVSVSNSFNKTTAVQSTRTMINIGNWGYWMLWDGQSGRDPITGDSGGIYPRGTVSNIFADGFLWGGIVDDASSDFPLRVGGSTYISGAVPGYVDASGSRVDPEQDSRIRIYRIRADWETLTPSLVTRDAAELNGVAQGAVTEAQQLTVIDQYAADWNEWPVDLGAPFNDLNGNGVYEPEQGETPGIANADQVAWAVMNDLNSAQTNNFSGSPSMGLEYQTVGWGYNQPGAALGQIVFKKYQFENISNFRIDSMYVCQWSDPDLGSYNDDVVGNDSVLSLAFVYNGGPNDAGYAGVGKPPAASGYDFFQGPLVEGVAGQDRNNNGVDDAVDTGIFNLQVVGPGLINLPMTSFAFFAAGDPLISDPPLGDYDGTRGWYNLLRGFIPTFDVDNPTPFTHRDGALVGRVTKFPLNGDPFDAIVNGNTDLDIDARGTNLSPADRRMVLATGPFVLQPGDLQEIVVAVMGGEGSTDISDPIAYLKAVNVVKAVDQVAQQLFDDLFQTVPKPPAQPSVTAIPFRESIVLDWGSDQAAVAATEQNNAATGYNFEGYNVYQLPNASSAISEGLKIATFDIPNGVTIIKGKRLLNETGTVETVTVQAGSDNGIQRHFTVDRNFLTGAELFPGSAYYFAVTAYNYNDFSVVAPLIEDSTLESGAANIGVVPQDPNPGVRYATTGSTLDIDASGATSDGIVQATIIDPTSLRDASYSVFFTEDTDTNSATFGELFWNVSRGGETIVANQRQAVNLAERNDQPIFDGIQVKVTGPKFDFKRFETVANNAGRLDAEEGAAADFQGFPSLRPSDAQQATADGHWMIHTGDNGSRGAYGDPDNPTGNNYLGRSTRNGAHWAEIIPYDFEWRWGTGTTMPGWDVFGSGAFIEVGFEIWNIGIGTPDDPSDDFQMYGIIIDSNGDGIWNYDGTDHSGSSATNDPQTDWLYFYNPTGHSSDEAPGNAAYTLIVDSIRAGTWTGFVGAEVIARQVLFNWNGGDVNDPTFPANTNQLLPEDGTVFRYTSNKPNTLTDNFAFTSTAPVASRAVAEQDVENINVYPNPYYAYNPQEPDRFNRFVTFSHLPAKATFRIFNLAGIQVRKIDKDDASQFQNWDLRNEDNLPVASGIYIVHIDMPDLNKEKVVKVYIIQGEEILRFF